MGEGAVNPAVGASPYDDALLDDFCSCRTGDGDGDAAFSHGGPFYFHTGRVLQAVRSGRHPVMVQS